MPPILQETSLHHTSPGWDHFVHEADFCLNSETYFMPSFCTGQKHPHEWCALLNLSPHLASANMGTGKSWSICACSCCPNALQPLHEASGALLEEPDLLCTAQCCPAHCQLQKTQPRSYLRHLCRHLGLYSLWAMACRTC